MSLYRLLKQIQLEREVANVISAVLSQRPLSANRAAQKIDYRQGMTQPCIVTCMLTAYVQSKAFAMTATCTVKSGLVRASVQTA